MTARAGVAGTARLAAEVLLPTLAGGVSSGGHARWRWPSGSNWIG
jgi:hypothetical protein